MHVQLWPIGGARAHGLATSNLLGGLMGLSWISVPNFTTFDQGVLWAAIDSNGRIIIIIIGKRTKTIGFCSFAAWPLIIIIGKRTKTIGFCSFAAWPLIIIIRKGRNTQVPCSFAAWAPIIIIRKGRNTQVTCSFAAWAPIRKGRNTQVPCSFAAWAPIRKGRNTQGSLQLRCMGPNYSCMQRCRGQAEWDSIN